MKSTYGAINALLVASALAGSALAADPTSGPATTPGATPSQPAAAATQANPKHKHHSGMQHEKAKKPDVNG